ncbi:MAG: hypothetical protein IK122_00875 [Alphaproteobacteria bacterium]|nr:hypothetical protein [Alphaproteobacteria bacterium]MBR6502603.1 hypothetical protein [Clostridia bacterium]
MATKKERELSEKGYLYIKTFSTSVAAKKEAEHFRKNGFYATVHMITRNGVPYYSLYAKDTKSKFAVWGGTVTAKNPIIVKAKSCDDALIIARNLNASGLNTVKRL